MKVKSLSYVRPSATPWTAAHQAPPSMGFSRQEYWSGVPLPSPIRHSYLWFKSKFIISRGFRIERRGLHQRCSWLSEKDLFLTSTILLALIFNFIDCFSSSSPMLSYKFISFHFLVFVLQNPLNLRFQIAVVLKLC